MQRCYNESMNQCINEHQIAQVVLGPIPRAHEKFTKHPDVFTKAWMSSVENTKAGAVFCFFVSVIFLWFPYDLFVKLRRVWMPHSSSSIQRRPFSEFPRLQDVSHSTFRWACKYIRISDQSTCLQIYSWTTGRRVFRIKNTMWTLMRTSCNSFESPEPSQCPVDAQ